MRIGKYFVILLLLCAAHTHGKRVHRNIDTPLHAAQKWFSAWEFVSQNIYKLKSYTPVEFVFFDENYVYSTSAISVPDGDNIEGPNLFKNKLFWKRKEHNGNITLPDNQIVPVGLMSFASPMDGQQSFFVMPLLSFWQTAGVVSNEIGIDVLVTGVFLHEFAHTQQMQNFGKKMTAFEANHTFSVNFSDDMVQDYFEKDSLYTVRFRAEVSRFYDASAAKNKNECKRLTAQALQMHSARQADYFTGELSVLKEIDDFFLTMEGIGQYTMYAWLIHAKGGNIAPIIAEKAVRRGGSSWSQEQGLALFLLLKKYMKADEFGPLMFGKETISVIELIKKSIQAKP